MAAGAGQNFQFFRQLTWFLGNNRPLFEFRYRIFRYLIIIIRLRKKSVRESQFQINHANHLNYFFSYFFTY